MEIYNSEEEQVAALKRWWIANGTSIISGIIVGVVIIGGWNFWKGYRESQIQQASAMFQELLKASEEKKIASVQKISEQLAENFASTPYAAYAGLIEAKTKVDQGDTVGAKQILQQISANANQELQHVAKLRLLQLMLAEGELEQGLQLIAEIDQSTLEGFEGSFEELKGDFFVALERQDEARTAYQNALRAGQTSPLLQFKLDDLTIPDLIESPE